MSIWKRIFRSDKNVNYDQDRKERLVQLASITKRDTILYATSWDQIKLKNFLPDGHSIIQALRDPFVDSKYEDRVPTSEELTAISVEGVQGLKEIVDNLNGDKLDLIIHSPGGAIDAAMEFVSHLRPRFEDVRVIVPHTAMSAATMISCAANTILMGKDSALGPIDPQITFNSGRGTKTVPAQYIIDDFLEAQEKSKNPRYSYVMHEFWSKYSHDVTSFAASTVEKTYENVAGWIYQYMFGSTNQARAEEITEYMMNPRNFKSHDDSISRDKIEQIGFKVEHMEDNQKIQDAVMSVFDATMHTFKNTDRFKIIENNLGDEYIV